jgi:hypothetical protein
MSTSINCVTKHKDILFIAEVRGDGGNTTGYRTPTEYYTADNCIVSSGVTSVVSILVCLIVVVIFYFGGSVLLIVLVFSIMSLISFVFVLCLVYQCCLCVLIVHS